MLSIDYPGIVTGGALLTRVDENEAVSSGPIFILTY
jgi:hypothetical protein